MSSKRLSKGSSLPHMLDEIMARQKVTLADAGFEDSALRGDHVLMSYIPEGPIKREPDGFPELRQCNFELVKRL